MIVTSMIEDDISAINNSFELKRNVMNENIKMGEMKICLKKENTQFWNLTQIQKQK